MNPRPFSAMQSMLARVGLERVESALNRLCHKIQR
jgi:hypothetical protein